MLRFLPFILPIIYALVMWQFSAIRTRKHLDANSVELVEPRLEPALRKLASALDVRRVKVFMLDDPTINGLAAPDGRIFITRGFLEKLRSGVVTADELTSVIAHELGHVALGHSRRRMVDFGGQSLLASLLSGILGRFLPGIGRYLVSGLMSLLSAKLSRSDEYEADAYATALLIKAGIGAEPQLTMFQKLDKLSGKSGAGPSWLLSHPATPDRIAAIEKNARNWA
ncbi:M48 family metallopeptidase [Marivivens donghaensis]|uniref:M48 family metallopeptidase n=1 Tax=Marivivens donghaensis TaxID=1699413 RepID=A0ABX0VZC8_9RHOB|nr:M48 family metallopeptidase [Marivivens donghaensis]NIY73110.1 M48 family metallopeptidase [Marivivens donghaensis]